MNSFFEKLKKGMGIEEPLKEKIEEKPKRKRAIKEPLEKVTPVKELKIETEPEKVAEEIKVEKIEKKETPEVETLEVKKEKWFETEGELAVDVYQTETDLVIQSAIAGVKPEFLDISMERDIITIKGMREKPFEEKGDYFTQECFWGPFSREVILPVEVDPDRAEATMKDGILTIRIPKILREKKRKIKVKI